MLPTIGLASGIGGRKPGAGEGPLVLREKLAGRLDWHAMIVSDEGSFNDCTAIAALNEKLAAAAFALSTKEPFFLSIGGDHSCAIGAWSGVAAAKRDEGKIGLLWIDAHMDAHTFETSESGNIHGMPLAALLGYGDPLLTNISHPSPKINPEHVALIGIRSFEEGEEALLKRLGVRVYYMEEIEKRGIDNVIQEAHEIVSRGTIGYGVSFDLDSLDPSHISAVGTPEPNGLDPKKTLEALAKKFCQSPPLAFELVEYNPSLDETGQTLAFIEQILEEVIMPVRSSLAPF